MKHICPYSSNRKCSVESLDECIDCFVKETFIGIYNDFPTHETKNKTVLVSRIFNSSKELTEYVNSNEISKEDIQQITERDNSYSLFWWETVTVEIPNNKTDDKGHMYLQKEVNHVYSERNGN